MELGHDKVVEVISEHRSRLHCTYKFCSPEQTTKPSKLISSPPNISTCLDSNGLTWPACFPSSLVSSSSSSGHILPSAQTQPKKVCVQIYIDCTDHQTRTTMHILPFSLKWSGFSRCFHQVYPMPALLTLAGKDRVGSEMCLPPNPHLKVTA